MQDFHAATLYASKPHLTEPLICRPKFVFMGLSHFFSSGVSLLEAGKNSHLAKTEKKYIDMISNDFNIPLIFCMSKDSKGFQYSIQHSKCYEKYRLNKMLVYKA